MQSEMVQKGTTNQQLLQMLEENVNEKTIRIFICSNINELFDMSIKLDEKSKTEILMERLNKIATKIITEYPRLYKLLCALGINKIYAKISIQTEEK